MRRALLIVAALLTLAPGCKRRDANGETAKKEGLKLVVILVIDQWPSWSFARDRGSLTGGLKRIVDNGIVLPRAELPYANTYTAPGHAAIATGAPPSVTGILGNSWYRDSANKTSCVIDEGVDTFGVGPRAGLSSRHLRVDGVADVLREQTSGAAKSVSISLKDRGSILLLGRKPDLAIWYEPDLPGVTTSSFYSATLPDWLVALNDKQPADRFKALWEPTDAALLARVTGIADDQAGEGEKYFDRTFPHDLRDLPAPISPRAIRLTPMSSDILFDTARAAVHEMKLGEDETPDLLGISISNHDYAGHYWGHESWERLDLFLRLDRDIGDFLEFLDDRVGKGKYAVVVTSDHGVNRLVELARAGGKDVFRVATASIVAAASKAATEVLGPGNWVIDCASSSVFMTEEFETQPADKQSQALAKMRAAVAALPGVGYVRDTASLRGDCAKMEPKDRLACMSTTNESGALFVAPTPGSIISSGYHTGTGHGSPNPEDRLVPVLLEVPGLEPTEDDSASSLLQVAPTLSLLLGIPSPPAAKEAPFSAVSAFPDERAAPAEPPR